MASRMSHSTPAMARRIVVRWAPDPCRSPGYTAPTSIPDTPEQQRDTALHRYPGVISIDEAPPAEALKAIRIRAAPPAIASSQPPQCDQIASPQALSSLAHRRQKLRNRRASFHVATVEMGEGRPVTTLMVPSENAGGWAESGAPNSPSPLRKDGTSSCCWTLPFHGQLDC
jgi:hypothetical protein